MTSFLFVLWMLWLSLVFLAFATVFEFDADAFQGKPLKDKIIAAGIVLLFTPVMMIVTLIDSLFDREG